MKKPAILILVAMASVLLFAQDKAAPAPTEINKKDSAKWTPTTHESATNDAQKKWLAKGVKQTLTGEVVDISCYLQLGKTGEKHIDCGSKCARSGQPVGLLTAKKELYVLMAEEHHPRRDGQADIRSTMANFMGKQVTVTGMVQQRKEGKAVFVSYMDLAK